MLTFKCSWSQHDIKFLHLVTYSHLNTPSGLTHYFAMAHQQDVFILQCIRTN